MSVTSLNPPLQKIELAKKLLNVSSATWFVTAVFGQWFFAYYIMSYYGGNALQGDWAAWSRRMIHGIVDGDMIGNIAVIIHISLAFVILVCGPLQLMPPIRNNFPAFHRFNGRIYLVTALVISVAAIYSIWTREAVIGGLTGQIATSLDGVLIILCAVKTVRFAMARKIKIHRQWALRLFIVVSGVWFFRIIRGFWIFINDGTSPGTNSNLTGPFDLILNFAGYLIPLLILEIYFRVKNGGGERSQFYMSGLLIGLSVATAIGIYQAALMFWIPNL